MHFATVRRVAGGLVVLVAALATATPAGATTAAATPVVDAAAAKCVAVAHHQDASHSGGACALRTTTKLVPRWTASLNGQAGYPLVATGKVFVTTVSGTVSGGSLWALDIGTGQPVWGPIPLSDTYDQYRIAYDNGRVYVNNFDGDVTAFSAASGRQQWTTQTSYFGGEPVVSDGVVFLQGAGTVFALDGRTGARLWSTSLDGTDGAVAADSTGVYVAAGCSRYRLARDTGAVIWSGNHGCTGGGGGTSYLANGRFLETTDHYLLNAATGKLLGSFAGLPAFAAGVGYYASGSTLFAQGVVSRTPVFSTTLPGAAVASPIVAGDVVYVAADDGKLYGVSTASGAIVQTTTLPAAPSNDLAVGQGRLIVPTATGVVALG